MGRRMPLDEDGSHESSASAKSGGFGGLSEMKGRQEQEKKNRKKKEKKREEGQRKRGVAFVPAVYGVFAYLVDTSTVTSGVKPCSHEQREKK